MSFPLIVLYLLWTENALSLFGIDLPHLESLRKTGNFFQSPKLNKTVHRGLQNFSNMFVTELVVFTSVNYCDDTA